MSHVTPLRDVDKLLPFVPSAIKETALGGSLALGRSPCHIWKYCSSPFTGWFGARRGSAASAGYTAAALLLDHVTHQVQ